MTDRELLELAAEAAGLQWDAPKEQWWDGSRGLWHDWNPLTDDGDALRLAVKLRINIYNPPGDRDVSASCWIEKTDIVRYFDQRSDTEDATRRAIVRAAAAIGEKL